MRQHFLDAWPSLIKYTIQIFFITFTCNPNWPKIQEASSQQPSQQANNRPYIVTRVFHLMLKELK